MKKRNFERHQDCQGTTAPFILIVAIVLGILLFPSQGRAGLILDAEIRLTYEDNVVGILSDQTSGQTVGPNTAPVMQAGGPGMGSGRSIYTGSTLTTSTSPGDFSGTVHAAIGGFSDVFSESTVFVKGFAEHTSYDTYSDLDVTMGGVSTGIATQLSKNSMARFSLTGKVKHFEDSQRNSTAYGGGVSLKERPAQDLWFRQFVEYEKNEADSPLFSYGGTKAGISAGYDLTRTTAAAAGFSYLVQEFDEPAGAELRTGTVFLTVEHALSRTWFFSAEYGLQTSRDGTSGTSITNNMYSLALRYSY